MFDAHREFRSPNFTDRTITPEYIVLHYTACDLAQTFKIFSDTTRASSAHLVIDTDGSVHELVPCLDGRALRAHHAGLSEWIEASAPGQAARALQAFNDFSIGIEIVNFNGNIFDYTDNQYRALTDVVRELGVHYESLRNSERVIGHEQISGVRGKVDPGWHFDWARFSNAAYPGQPTPTREPRLPESMRESLSMMIDLAPADPEQRNEFWMRLSTFTERAIGEIAARARRES